MDAKYVIAASGDVAIFSKYLGMEHREVGGLMDAFAEENAIAGAGFCSMIDDQLITFGRSTSTGISAQPEDAKTLTGLLHTGGLKLVWIERKLGFVATNAPQWFDGEVQPCTPALLLASKIFK